MKKVAGWLLRHVADKRVVRAVPPEPSPAGHLVGRQVIAEVDATGKASDELALELPKEGDLTAGMYVPIAVVTELLKWRKEVITKGLGNALDIELIERLNAQMEAAVVEGKRLLATGADTAGDTSGDDFNRAHAELTEHLLANLPSIIENAKWREAYDEQFPDLDPNDSIALTELRAAIDDHLGWDTDEEEMNGDYVARLKEVGALLECMEDV